MTPLQRILWSLLLGALLALIVQSAPVMTGHPDTFPEPLRLKYLEYRWWLAGHAIGSVVALALMPFLLWNAARVRWPKAHRIGGRVAITATLACGVTGVRMGWDAHGGPVGAAGFLLVSVLVLVCAVMAFRRARARQFALHRRWVIRLFTLLACAAAFRLSINAMAFTPVDFDAAYGVLVWTSWLPPLAVVEWWLRRRPAPATKSPATAAACRSVHAKDSTPALGDGNPRQDSQQHPLNGALHAMALLLCRLHNT